MSRYDGRTTTFSPQGRLSQVEYAVEATKQSGPALGIVGKDCVVLAGEKKNASKLLDQGRMAEKLFEVDDHMCCAVAGLSSDANTLISYIRLMAQQYTYGYGEPMPVEQLVSSVCQRKQINTQQGGNRPFGVSFLFAGYDRHHKFQLYHTDPAGVYSGWRAHCIGSLNNATTDQLLKTEWKDDLTQQQVKELAARVLMKNSDTAAPVATNFEWGMICKDALSGEVVYKKMKDDEVTKLLVDAKAKEDAAAGGA